MFGLTFIVQLHAILVYYPAVSLLVFYCNVTWIGQCCGLGTWDAMIQGLIKVRRMINCQSKDFER